MLSEPVHRVPAHVFSILHSLGWRVNNKMYPAQLSQSALNAEMWQPAAAPVSPHLTCPSGNTVGSVPVKCLVSGAHLSPPVHVTDNADTGRQAALLSLLTAVCSVSSVLSVRGLALTSSHNISHSHSTCHHTHTAPVTSPCWGPVLMLCMFSDQVPVTRRVQEAGDAPAATQVT